MRSSDVSYKGGRFRYLSDSQIEKIHMASLEILETSGIRIYDETGLSVFRQGGAYVDSDCIVRIPVHMVEAAISSAPSVISLCGMEGGSRLRIGGSNVYFGTGTDLPTFLDHETGEYRPSVLSDVGNVAKICEAADGIDFISSQALASDVRQDASELYHFIESRTWSRKPIWITSTDYGNTKAIIDMAAFIAGSHDALRRNPTLGIFTDPASPLKGPEESVQKLMLCAEYGIPVTWSSGIMAGATGPATLAGTIALGNAEGLAGLVLHQLVSPGAPFIYGLIGSIMDMRTMISVYGGPELPMIHAAVGQLGRYYALPSFGTGGCGDACAVDAQAGMEAMLSNFWAALNGTNLVHDNGYLGSGMIGSLEMTLLAGEINDFVKRIESGIEVSDETLCLDLIRKVGPGGSFIAEKHTARNFRKETFYPRFLNRKQHRQWEAEGRITLAETLRKRATEIVSEARPILGGDEIAGLRAILDARISALDAAGFHREGCPRA
jgi:trimethylamine--corrinoid protein Co-methyltransferase